jgi:hypothetical protein
MSASTRAMIGWLADKDPDVWFATTPLLNWDNAVPVLKWIVSQPQCDKANAAAIFWSADPGYYAGRLAAGEKPSGDGWSLIQTIIKNWNSGFYVRSGLQWPDADGRAAMSSYERGIAAHPDARQALDIPVGLFGPLGGRAPSIPPELTPAENPELWDLLDRLGTRAGFRPGSDLWRAQRDGSWKPPGAATRDRSGLGVEARPGPAARAAGIALLALSALGLLWVLYVNFLRR